MKKAINTGRKSFIKKSLMLSALPLINIRSLFQNNPEANFKSNVTERNFPLVISTWSHGMAANEVAYKVLSERG